MTRRFRKGDSIVERKVRDSVILVPFKTGPARLDALYTLNETAGFIWQQIDQGLAEEEIVSRVKDAYDIDNTVAQNDVRQTLDGLAAIGAVVVTEQVA